MAPFFVDFLWDRLDRSKNNNEPLKVTPLSSTPTPNPMMFYSHFLSQGAHPQHPRYQTLGHSSRTGASWLVIPHLPLWIFPRLIGVQIQYSLKEANHLWNRKKISRVSMFETSQFQNYCQAIGKIQDCWDGSSPIFPYKPEFHFQGNFMKLRSTCPTPLACWVKRSAMGL